MIDYILLTSLSIYAIHTATRPQMILEWLKVKVNQRLLLQLDINPEKLVYLNKWLWDCPPCMATLYGTIAFFLFCLPLYLLPVFVLSVSGLNAVIVKL
jgi:hypothetical protein